MESRSALKARLTAEGRWEAFVSMRESLRSEAGDDAWRVAAEAFPPLSAEQLAARLDAAAAQQNLIQRLASEIEPSATVSEREMLRWVFEFAMVAVADLDAAAIPSRGALGLLAYVQHSPANYKDFLRLWEKLLPTRNQRDEEASDRHDLNLQLLADLETELAAGPQDAGGKRAVPEADLGEGGA